MLPPIETAEIAEQNDTEAMHRMAEQWVLSDLPVYRKTLAQLEHVTKDPDLTNVNMMSEVVLRDPLMTLKVLSRIAPMARAKNAARPETVTAATVWLGVAPFFEVFGKAPVLEEVLSGRPEALETIRSITARSCRAGRLAQGLAVQRNDTDASVIYESALVNDFAEIMLWIHHEPLAQQIRRLHSGNSDVSSLQAQQQVLGFTLQGLTRELLDRWQMPRLMRRLADPASAEDRQMYCAQLGIQMARHLQSGWSHPKMAEDLQRVADLLCISVATARQVIEQIEE
jgi:hypothetical protein